MPSPPSPDDLSPRARALLNALELVNRPVLNDPRNVLTGTPGPWEYKAVPFIASTASGVDRAQAAASQFETLLTEMNEVGFEYLRMDHYSLTEAPGCLGALFGARVTVIPYDVAIFRRASNR